MRLLKNRIDDYWAQHSSQTSLFYASIAIIILLFGVIFLVLRMFWQDRNHQQLLLEQNRMLELERDKQKELNERLEEATQSKLMFFTNVSHDLRNPLTLIAEPVAQLASASNLTEQQHTLMKIADKNVRILRRLINQILDFRKYENDKLTLHLSEIDFGKAVGDWMESFYSLARKRDIRLSLDAPSDCGEVFVAVDAEKIERVFFNLLSNAFKYTPDNGSITVRYRLEEDSLVLSVADTGEGISERDLGNIFDRFYQVDRVHPKGSGIGLFLSKAFVELHGGSIGVDKPVVLVVDDNCDIQQLVGTLLGSSYNVLTASDGAEGVRKAIKYVPDLVVCDVMMPVMDGMECCSRPVRWTNSVSRVMTAVPTGICPSRSAARCFSRVARP